MVIKGSTKKTVKPPEVVRRIIRGKLAGQTTAAVARAEGVHRDTVLRILTLPEIRERMEFARLRIVNEAEPMTERLVDIAMGRKKGDWHALVETLKVSLVLSAIYCRACLFVIGYTELLHAAFYAPCPPWERWRNPLTTP